MLEAVQRRAVKAVSNLRGKSYVERLTELEMDTLEERRKRRHLVQAYRVISGKDSVLPATWFQFCQPREGKVSTRHTAGHLNVIPKHPKGEISQSE